MTPGSPCQQEGRGLVLTCGHTHQGPDPHVLAGLLELCLDQLFLTAFLQGNNGLKPKDSEFCVQTLALAYQLSGRAQSESSSPGMEPRRRLWSLAGGVGCWGWEAGLAEVEVGQRWALLVLCWTQPPQELTEKAPASSLLPRLPLCDRWPRLPPWRLRVAGRAEPCVQSVSFAPQGLRFSGVNDTDFECICWVTRWCPACCGGALSVPAGAAASSHPPVPISLR